NIPPARAGQLNDLLGELVELDGQEGLALLAVAVEGPHARDDVGDVVAGGLDVMQILAGGFGEILPPQQQFGEARYGREGVVDVVSNAAGHLAQGAEPLVL